jgi:hypothetical protein
MAGPIDVLKATGFASAQQNSEHEVTRFGIRNFQTQTDQTQLTGKSF